MIPAEVIERARDAALVDASRVETRLTMGSVDAALRSLLADLREFMVGQDLWAEARDNGRGEIYDGISALLRELGDE